MNKKEAATLGGKKRGAQLRQEAAQRYETNPKLCDFCHKPIPLNGKRPCDVRRFCNRSCAASLNNTEYPKRTKRDTSPPKPRTYKPNSGTWTTAQGANLRRLRAQLLRVEAEQAELLREQGFEVYSPTAVCDRIAVKDGKVFFVEFKRHDQPKLRPGQRRIAELVPDQYRVILHDWEQEVFFDRETS